MRDNSANRASPLITGDPWARPPRSTTNGSRSIAIVLYDGFTPFDLGVACEVFGDDRWVPDGDSWYRLYICAESSGPVTAADGFQILVPHGLQILSEVDTVIVVPTYQPDEVPDAVVEALRQAHYRGCRLVSFCAGAFVLAATGLLDGRRAAAHWDDCDELARRFPNVSVDSNVLYVDDGDILTGAGSAAGIDLCLHIVRQDYGSEVATRLARQLVVPPQRDGDQAQYIEAPLPVLDTSDLFAETIEWVQGSLDQPITVEDLAERSAMSPRTFARRFVSAMACSPYQWLLRQRVQLARRLLESSDLSVEQVAEKSGFQTANNLRKHFGRVVHTSPKAYRDAFMDRTVA
jgi:AraC family transcriptional regulator, transcriptional activator FtrA